MFIWTEGLLRPIFNFLVYLYNVIPGQDLGVAIIVLTLIIRLVLYPLNRKSIVSQRALQKVQPQVEELKEKFKDDREKLGKEMMALYKREKINPFSSCLPLLIQLPILIAVYRVFIHLLNGDSLDTLLYSTVAHPGMIETLAFGFLDLAKRSIPLAILAGAAQYWQTKMLMNKNEKKGGMASAMSKQMLYMMPVITVVIGATFPAGLTLYWFATTALSGLQQVWMIKRKQIEKAE
jgi:YidC/Oxa1 family membrane protein insertase